jgi:hypothetical protein
MQDYTLFVHLLDASGQQLGQQDLPPLDGNYGTSEWPAGQVVRQRLTIAVAGDATPGPATLAMGLYGQGQSRLDWTDGQGNDLGNQLTLVLRPVVRWPAEANAPAMGQAQSAELGDVAALRGWDSEIVAGDEGRTLRLTLYWQCLGETASDYTVFVHLTDAAGQMVAQQDQYPGAAAADRRLGGGRIHH